jgi:hypothetical protein
VLKRETCAACQRYGELVQERWATLEGYLRLARAPQAPLAPTRLALQHAQCLMQELVCDLQEWEMHDWTEHTLRATPND